MQFVEITPHKIVHAVQALRSVRLRIGKLFNTANSLPF